MRCLAILRAASALRLEHHATIMLIVSVTPPSRCSCALIQVNKARYGNGFAACAKTHARDDGRGAMARVPPLAEYIYTPDVTLRRARAGAQLPRDETDEDFLDKPDGGACGGSTRAARMRAREHARAPPDERSVASPAPVVAPPQQSSPAGPSVHFETGGSAGVRIPAGASAGIAPRDTAIRVRRWCAAAHRWGAWEEASVPHAPADTGDGDAAACAHDGAALTLRLRRGA